MKQNDNGQTTLRCQNCGRTIKSSHMYCSACGAKNPWYGSNVSQNSDHDELPVINTDDIFGNLDYLDHKQEKKNNNEEDDLPVINTDGLFDDVPFADTSTYNKTTESNSSPASQYYNLGSHSEAEWKEKKENNPSQNNSYQYQDKENSQFQRGYEYHGQPKEASYERKQGQRNSYVRPEAPTRTTGGDRYAQSKSDIQNERMQQDQRDEKPKKSKKKFAIIGALLVVAIAVGLGGFFLFGNKGKQADLMDICGYKFEGVNGKGTVTFEFNENCDLYSNFFIQDNTEACDALKSITFTATPGTGLSNGDVVTIQTDYSRANLTKYGLKVVNDTKQVVVSGLADATQYDLFKDVTVKFEGYDGSGTASIDVTGCDEFTINNIKYSFQGDSTNLKNGDKVVVFAQVEASALEKNNYEAGADTKEFIVQGLEGTKSVDVFKDITISYTGASPKLSLSVDKSSSDSFIQDKVSFELSKKDGVAVGDTIIITAKFNDEDAKQAGYEVDTTTKKVVVSNVPTYIASITKRQASSLDSELLGRMEDKEDENGDSYVFDREINDLFGDDGEYEYIKASKEKALGYFLYNKDKEEVNSYILVEKYIITAENTLTGEQKEAVLYAEATISNIILDKDGKTLTYEEPSTIVTDTDLNYFINKVNGLGYKITSIK